MPDFHLSDGRTLTTEELARLAERLRRIHPDACLHPDECALQPGCLAALGEPLQPLQTLADAADVIEGMGAQMARLVMEEAELTGLFEALAARGFRWRLDWHPGATGPASPAPSAAAVPPRRGIALVSFGRPHVARFDFDAHDRTIGGAVRAARAVLAGVLADASAADPPG